MSKKREFMDTDHSVMIACGGVGGLRGYRGINGDGK